MSKGIHQIIECICGIAMQKIYFESTRNFAKIEFCTERNTINLEVKSQIKMVNVFCFNVKNLILGLSLHNTYTG